MKGARKNEFHFALTFMREIVKLRIMTPVKNLGADLDFKSYAVVVVTKKTKGEMINND